MPKRIPGWIARNFPIIAGTVVVAAVGIMITISLLQIRDALRQGGEPTPQPTPTVVVSMVPVPLSGSEGQSGGGGATGQSTVIRGSTGATGPQGATGATGASGQDSVINPPPVCVGSTCLLK